MTSTEAIEQRRRVNRAWSHEERATVYSESLTILGIDPKTVRNWKHARDLIHKGLDAAINMAYAQEKGIEPGDRVRSRSGKEGTVTSVRKDGCLQVRIDKGNSLGLNALYLEKI